MIRLRAGLSLAFFIKSIYLDSGLEQLISLLRTSAQLQLFVVIEGK